MQTYDFRLHSCKRIWDFYRTRCIFWQEVHMHVCVWRGAHSNSNSPLPSLSLQGKLLTPGRHLFSRIIVCFSQFQKCYCTLGMARYSYLQHRWQTESGLPTCCNTKCSLPFGKGKVSVQNFSPHTKPSTTLTDVSLAKKLRLPWTCRSISRVHSPSSLPSSNTECFLERIS